MELQNNNLDPNMDPNNNLNDNNTPSMEQPNAAAQQPQPPVYAPAPSNYGAARREKNKNRGLGTKGIVALSLCCALVGGLTGFGGAVVYQNLRGPKIPSSVSQTLMGQRETSVINVNQIDTSKEMSPAEVYAKNVNSTVGIQTSVTTNYFGYQTMAAASGSGFIISDTGYILTNYHVVESSDSITVSLYDGSSYDAELIGYDESNDVAVLKIEAEGLVPVILGDSDNMNVGDPVVAIGNPLGELTFSLTSGAVSAMDREITLSSGVTMDLIQTDCAINSGNSGGALFNLYGEVVGITNAKYSGSGSSSEASIDNIGFAIPINHARAIAESIIENGYIAKPYIGVSVMDVSAETQNYGLPSGAAVKSVTEDGPAAKAGLQVNDIITAVDGEAITGSKQLVRIVGAHNKGDQLVFSVYRQGQTLDITVTIGEQVQSALANEEQQAQQQQQQSQGSSGFPFGYGFWNW